MTPTDPEYYVNRDFRPWYFKKVGNKITTISKYVEFTETWGPDHDKRVRTGFLVKTTKELAESRLKS